MVARTFCPSLISFRANLGIGVRMRGVCTSSFVNIFSLKVPPSSNIKHLEHLFLFLFVCFVCLFILFFSQRKKKENQEQKETKQISVYILRKWDPTCTSWVLLEYICIPTWITIISKYVHTQSTHISIIKLCCLLSLYSNVLALPLSRFVIFLMKI